MRRILGAGLAAVLGLAACARHVPVSAPPAPPAADLTNGPDDRSRRVAAFATGSGTAEVPWVAWEDAFDGLSLTESYDIVFDAGLYRQDVEIGLPVNMTGSLVIRGKGRPVISLGAATYFVAPVKHADHDVWRNLTIDGIAIDANRKGGRAATIGGDLDGAATQDLSKENIVLRNLDVYDQLLDYHNTAKNHRGSVSLEVDASPGAAQPAFVRNVVIEDSTFTGGNWGILITGSNRNPSQQTIENVTIRNVVNDERPPGARVQRAFFPSTCFHVGQDAGQVDGVVFENLTCYAPGDNCFEVNNAKRASLTGLACYNPVITGFTINNFQPLADPGEQLNEVRNSKVVVDADYPTVVGPYAIVAASGNGYPFGTLAVDGFSHVYEGTRSMNPGIASFLFSSHPTKHVILRNIDLSQSWTKQGSGALYRYDVVARGQKLDWDGDGAPDLPRLTIERVRSRHTFTEAAGRTVKRGIYIEGDEDFTIADYALTVNGGTADEITGLYVGGSTTGAKTIRGDVAGFRADLVSSTRGATRAVSVSGTDQIVPESLVLRGVKPGPATGRSFIDPTVHDKVILTSPRPATD